MFLILWLGSLGVLLIFYVVVWYRFGRDLPKGVIVPSWKPPHGISPAAARYVMRMDFDKKVLGAAMVSLAVKGHLTIEKTGDLEYTLHRRTAPTCANLSRGEQALMRGLFDRGHSVVATNGNCIRLRQAAGALNNALSRNHDKAHFMNNFLVMFEGSVLTVLLAAASSMIYATLGQADRDGPLMIVIIGSGLLLSVLFDRLMRAPTVSGRQLMDEIEGFRMYLLAAGHGRLSPSQAPDRTLELFEECLPYAIALDIEREWGDHFTAVLADGATGHGNGHCPDWYLGHSGWCSHGDFASSLGSDFSAAIWSAATARN